MPRVMVARARARVMVRARVRAWVGAWVRAWARAWARLGRDTVASRGGARALQLRRGAPGSWPCQRLPIGVACYRGGMR